jgi:hypothetical protein
MEPSGSQQTRVPQSNLPCESARDVAGCRRLPGHRNCSKREMPNLLGIMKDLMPVGGEKWDKVLDRHSSIRFPGREVDCLRRQFS